MRSSQIDVLMVGSAQAAAATLANQPVKHLDLQRYLGQWHEIAHLPMFFQRRCVDSVTANYSLRSDGKVSVRNACRNQDGEMETSNGVARTTGNAASGALKVRFAPALLAWLPWVWADYWVIDLDPGYQWAVVGSPSHKYLWILSRSPDMKQDLFDTLQQRARQRGYAVEKLVVTAPLR